MNNIKNFNDFQTNEGKLGRAVGAAALGAATMFGSPNVKAAEKPRTEVGPGDTVLVTHPSDLTQLMINTYSNAKSRLI